MPPIYIGDKPLTALRIGAQIIDAVYYGSTRVFSSSGFDPSDLFVSGEKGVWYDPSDISTMFQDSAGTIPVTTTGQPIGKILDLSGHGFHQVQATAGKRPVFSTASAKAAISFDGVSASMSAASVDMSACTKSTLVIGIKLNSAATQAIAEFGTSPTSSGGFSAFVGNGPSGSIGAGLGTGPAYIFPSGPAATAPGTVVITIEYDPMAAGFENKAGIRVNGLALYETLVAGTGTLTTAAFGILSLYLGARAGTSLYLSGDIYSFVLVGRQVTTNERHSLEEWSALKAGANFGTEYTYDLNPTQFTDSGTVVPFSAHMQASAYSSVQLSTSASVIEVDLYNNLYAAFPQFTDVGVFINGVYSQTLTPGVIGSTVHTINPPMGINTITLVNGLQSRPSSTGPVLGTWVTRIQADAPITQGNLNPTNRILIYGDSIAVGGNATGSTQYNAWAMKVRAAYAPDSVALEAWGSRSLHEDCSSAPLQAAFVVAMAAYAPERIWLAIGTNDYGLNKWSAAAFGAAYAALLDGLHAALPSATIYCQSPILRSTETANGSGSTMGNYRTQISTAASARSGYCTFVDGTAFMTTGSLADGVHPTSAGHALYATAVQTVLGL